MTEQQEAAQNQPTEQAPSEQIENQSTEQAQAIQPKDHQPYVDLSTLPDDIRGPVEARFAELSRIIKKTEKKGESRISEYRGLIEEQARLLEELQGGMGAVVDHLQTNTIASTEASLKAQLRQAKDLGDTVLEDEIQDKILELKAQKIALKQNKAQPKPKNETRAQAFAGHPTLEEDDSGDLSTEELAQAELWVAEKDSSGQPLRPWATSKSPQEPLADPVYRRAMIEMAAVFEPTSPYAHLTMDKKLEEVDRRMGLQKRPAQQQVMGGGFTPRGKNNTLQLTDSQKRIAIKTKYGASHGAKSDAEYIEAYRKQVQSIKGAR